MNLSRQLGLLRRDRGLSLLALAECAGVDRATVAALERGEGTLASLKKVAGALGSYVSPLPSALGAKRQWHGLSMRVLATMAGRTHATVASLEAKGDGRLTTYEAVASALGERPRLVPLEDTWSTPPNILQAVLDGLGIQQFDLDVASPVVPTVPCSRWYTEAQGGLFSPWDAKWVWCNPPYDDVPRWLDKAIVEHVKGRARVVAMLIPYEPRANATQRMIESAGAVFVLSQRLRFGGRSYLAPFASALATWGLSDGDLRRLGASLPPHHRITAAVALEAPVNA